MLARHAHTTFRKGLRRLTCHSRHRGYSAAAAICFPQRVLFTRFRSTCSIRLKASANDAVSAVIAGAQELTRAGVSAAGLATYAEHTARAPYLLRCCIFDVPGHQSDPLADSLLSFGALSTSTEEFRSPGQAEQKIYADGTSKTWDRCTVSALFPAEHNIRGTLELVQQVLQISLHKHETQEVPDQEWVDAMKASYQPTEVCSGLWIVPDWCEPPQLDALNIRMAPGLAFGTGDHSTTRLCLQWLFRHRDKVKGARVMDYGTGSGVLAVAALLLGAAYAVGTDVDPLAVKAARDNAALNSVGNKLTAVHCSPSAEDPDPVQSLGLQDQQFDICMANILRGPLMDLQPRLSGYVRSGGHLLLSGILELQVDKVQAAYSGSFDDMQCDEESSWALLSGVKQKIRAD